MADGRGSPETYTVYDRGDVKDKLDDLGVDSVREIRRAHGSYRHELAHAGAAERLDLQASAAPGQLAADIDALSRARDALRQQADAVARLLEEARELASPMQDGHGPIAKAMKAAFRERADDANGAVRALTDYRDELHLVLTAIQQTLESYRHSEVFATRRLTASGGDGG